MDWKQVQFYQLLDKWASIPSSWRQPFLQQGTIAGLCDVFFRHASCLDIILSNLQMDHHVLQFVPALGG